MDIMYEKIGINSYKPNSNVANEPVEVKPISSKFLPNGCDKCSSLRTLNQKLTFQRLCRDEIISRNKKKIEELLLKVAEQDFQIKALCEIGDLSVEQTYWYELKGIYK